MLHTETIAPVTLGLLKELMMKPYLKGFQLVGETGMSLQMGHRISIDLDLFSNEIFDSQELKSYLIDDFSLFQIVLERKNTLITSINEIKVDFIRFNYSFDYPLVVEDGIRIADIKDIATMKLDAIAGRGKKKDFFDLYFLLQRFSLVELLELYQTKFKHTTVFHVIKSINYFEDAEDDAEPVVLDKKVTWAIVKQSIVKEIQKL